MKTLYLEKAKRLEKISKKEQEELVVDFVNAIALANSVNDVILFLQDLLTQSEMKILSRRLRIAKLLLNGMTYEQIEQRLHVSHGTVAKIAAWLTDRGDGFRKIINKLPKQVNDTAWREYSEWDRLKRRYPLHFWPEILLEEIVKRANQKHKDRIKNVLEQLKEKSELHRRIEKLLNYNHKV